MKIVIANVKYSPNLGDGLLSECLEFGLLKSGFGNFYITSCDLAGRTKYEKKQHTRRAVVLRILNSTPSGVRRIVVKAIMKKKRGVWRRHYQKMIQGADAVVIGGGNLFTDVDMNFPSKLSTLLELAKEYHTPVFIYGVGVGSNWSQEGLLILKSALNGCSVPYVSVRDSQSLSNFNNLFGVVVKTKAILVRDPGLIASKLREAVKVRQTSGVGICVTSPLAISYHSERKISTRELISWYLHLVKRLKGEGLTVNLFTNGGEEDVDFAKKIVDMHNRNTTDSLEVYSAANPFELVSYISTLRVLTAFRMHALICAYSFGIRVLACKWDPKVESFMSSIGREEHVFDVANISPDDMAEIIMMNNERPCFNYLSFVLEAESDISNLAKELVFRVQPSSFYKYSA